MFPEIIPPEKYAKTPLTRVKNKLPSITASFILELRRDMVVYFLLGYRNDTTNSEMFCYNSLEITIVASNFQLQQASLENNDRCL
mmetsp:Transcript_27119/g.31371  ORF Transcript_27119/g.31371 Transcript_27119/m.31371 type:complete len:85 (+) Transcript_27119:815-1069(+)